MKPSSLHCLQAFVLYLGLTHKSSLIILEFGSYWCGVGTGALPLQNPNFLENETALLPLQGVVCFVKMSVVLFQLAQIQSRIVRIFAGKSSFIACSINMDGTGIVGVACTE